MARVVLMHPRSGMSHMARSVVREAQALKEEEGAIRRGSSVVAACCGGAGGARIELVRQDTR
jgi:hypothetical protein